MQDAVQDQVRVRSFARTTQSAQEASISSPSSTQPVRRENLRSAFRETVQRAQEPENPVQAMNHSNNKGEGKVTFKKQKFVVTPSLSDFVADVQLTARRILTQSEFHYFQRTYFGDMTTGYLGIADADDPLDLTPDGKDKFFEKHIASYPVSVQQEVRKLDHKIRVRLGEEFMKVGLFPESFYFNQDRQDIRKPMSERIEIHNMTRRTKVEHFTQA